jgi:putative aminopeptidase FrvX
MSHRMTKTSMALAAVICLAVAGRAADVKTMVKELFAVPSTTGHEGALAARIRVLLPRGTTVETSGLGTIAVRLPGRTGPTLLLAGLDGYGHMVSGITPEGYLTLDRPVPAPNAGFDAFLLGQPVVISTAKGPVQGVVAQPAMHLLTPERRKALVENFALETAFVDIGARSGREALARGVALLDPVTYPAILTELSGNCWAGPGLGQKAVAAVLAAAAGEASGRTGGDETVIAWAAQTKFLVRGRGLRPPVGAAQAMALWRPRRAVIVDTVAAGRAGGFPVLGGGPAVLRADAAGSRGLARAFEEEAAAAGLACQSGVGPASPLRVPFAELAENCLTLALPVEFLNTPSEVVSLKDIEALRDLLVRFLHAGAER